MIPVFVILISNFQSANPLPMYPSDSSSKSILKSLTISPSLVNVRFHGLVTVLGSEMHLSGEHHLDVLLGGL